MGLRDNKLFAVKMPADATCDCGVEAETQFAIAVSKKEAAQLGKEVQRARDLGSKASDVVCGLCIARRISDKGLIVAEIMKYSPIKLDRVTFDTECVDCTKKLPFGTYAHFHADSGQAICVECGAKRGWTDKARASTTVKMLELKEDIKSLRKRFKVEAEGLYLLESTVDLHQVAQNYVELDRQINGALAKLSSYLESVATPEEKRILEELAKGIRDLQDIAQEIKKEFENRLFLMDRAERNHKMLQKVFADADSETEEAQRHAEMAYSEVPPA